ncbi:MAG: biopolymer transporter ExbD [Planctomycetota bacterium]
MRRASSIARLGGADIGRINVTPLIDVVMCLIVFFLLVGQLALDRRGSDPLPRTLFGERAEPPEPVVVSVLDGGLVLLDGVERPVESLETALAGRLAREPGLRLRVRAGRDRDFAEVRPVLAAAGEAGIATLELATERLP